MTPADRLRAAAQAIRAIGPTTVTPEGPALWQALQNMTDLQRLGFGNREIALDIASALEAEADAIGGVEVISYPPLTEVLVSLADLVLANARGAQR